MLPGLQAPSARVHCLGNELDFGDVVTLHYPAIPATGAYLVDTNATFLIPSSLAQNTSKIRTFWIPKPTTTPDIQGDQADEGDTMQLPSVFLAIQIPTLSESVGLIFACSIDARWITNTTQLMHTANDQILPNMANSQSTYTQISAATFDAHGRPGKSGMSPMLDLDISWLEQLTPTFNETLPGTNISRVSPGYTSMARSIMSSPIATVLQNNSTTIWEAGAYFEMLATLLTVDGMARVNTYPFESWPVASRWVFATNESGDPYVLLAGGGGTDPISRNTSELSYPEYLWSVSISGYAYAIESTADILALVVIFVYMIFALGHICFMLYKKWYSLEWWSVTDIIALSQNSLRSDLLKNTSGGIKMASTSRLLLRLRAQNVPLGDRESLHVLISKDKDDSSNSRPSDYHKIEKEKASY